MGGELCVESEEGKGSRFYFRLTLAKAQGPVANHATLSHMPILMPTLSKSLRILVAEDTQVNQRVIKAILGKMGHEIRFAENGREAVELFEHEAFDLILMDIQMPEMNGLSAARAIRALESGRGHVPILALSASAMESDRAQSLQSGMDGHLTKPLDIAQLEKEIVRLCTTAAA
jgi:CheY-like chemotaxis protein